MNCQQNRCDKKAEYTVLWPNQVTQQCEKHKDQVVALGQVMGIQVPVIKHLDIVDDQEK